jgi:hypothetical protein
VKTGSIFYLISWYQPDGAVDDANESFPELRFGLTIQPRRRAFPNGWRDWVIGASNLNIVFSNIMSYWDSIDPSTTGHLTPEISEPKR